MKVKGDGCVPGRDQKKERDYRDTKDRSTKGNTFKRDTRPPRLRVAMTRGPVNKALRECGGEKR